MVGLLAICVGLAAALLSGQGQPALGSVPAKVRVTQVRTDFGYVNARQVKAPVRGRCVPIPVVFDVRNVQRLPRGSIQVGLLGEFDNIYAYAIWQHADVTAAGKYAVTMQACGMPHTYTRPGGTRTDTLEAYNPKDPVELRVQTLAWPDISQQYLGSAGYAFAA